VAGGAFLGSSEQRLPSRRHICQEFLPLGVLLPPVITPSNQTVAAAQQVNLSDLFSVSSSGITQYKIWYSWPEKGAPAHGIVTNNGVPIPTDQWVSFSSLDGLKYTGTDFSGTDSIWLIANNGQSSNQARSYVTLTNPADSFGDPMFRNINLTRRDLPDEMVRLANDAYPRSGYDFALPLGSNLDARKSADIQSTGWHLVTSSELGLSFTIINTFSFTDGFYQALSYTGPDTLNGDPSEADALVLTGMINGKRTLAVVFVRDGSKIGLAGLRRFLRPLREVCNPHHGAQELRR